MDGSDLDPDFKRSVSFGVVGSLAAVASSFLPNEILESFGLYVILVVLAVGCLAAASHYYRKSDQTLF